MTLNIFYIRTFFSANMRHFQPLLTKNKIKIPFDLFFMNNLLATGNNWLGVRKICTIQTKTNCIKLRNND